MSTISLKTRERIKGYLEGFIQGLIDAYKIRLIEQTVTIEDYLSRKSTKGELKPFHAAMIPPEILNINLFERGFSTRLGHSLEECAHLIALEHHREVHRGYDLKVEVSQAAYAEAERQKEHYDSTTNNKESQSSFEQMIALVLNAQRSDDLLHKKVRVDLFIITHDGTELLFEIKSPKPNKGQCLEVTQRLLRFHLLRGKNRPHVQAYYAMPYNPYGSQRSDYKWTYSQKYMPFDEAVLIGDEFWQMIGGNTTYQELLEIDQEVGQVKSKSIIEQLSF